MIVAADVLYEKKQIEFFLQRDLKLTLHPQKSFIQNINQGVCFVGYRIFPNYTLIRGSTLIHFQKKYHQKMKKYQKKLISWEEVKRCQNSFQGHLKHANAYHLSKNLFKY